MKVEQKSAGIVVARALASDYAILLLRAYRNWDFPKGLIEPGEAPLSAAIRETNEETGLADLRFRWGFDFVETEPYANGKIARYYLAEIAGLAPGAADAVRLAVNPDLGRPEHHEFRWVAIADSVALLPPRLLPVIKWAQRLLNSTSTLANSASLD